MQGLVAMMWSLEFTLSMMRYLAISCLWRVLCKEVARSDCCVESGPLGARVGRPGTESTGGKLRGCGGLDQGGGRGSRHVFRIPFKSRVSKIC